MADSDTTTASRVLLIDALSIVRRCFEANPTDDIDDRVRGTLKSAAGSFRRALRQHQPDYAVAVFDQGGPTWRHQRWPDYKRGRTPMPQELRDALPCFQKSLLSDLHLASITVPEVEADDVLATLNDAWKRRGSGECIVLSQDKDLLQLAGDSTRIYDHFKEEWRDAQWVQEKFGVPPSKLADFLAFTGDRVDGVPGVSGIGAVCAAHLINTVGGVSDVIAAAPQLPGSIGKRVREGTDMLVVSRVLVSLKTDVTLGITWRQLRFHAPNTPV